MLIDWQQLDPTYTSDYTSLPHADRRRRCTEPISRSGSPSRRANDYTTFDLAALQLTVDRFVAVLHDENSETDAPGPIASLPWLEGWLKVMSEFGEPSQWVGCSAAYAYDWNTDDQEGRDDYLQGRHDARQLRRRGPGQQSDRRRWRRISTAPTPIPRPMATSTASPFSTRSRSQPAPRRAPSAKLGGIGIARLGTEDPQIWDVLDAKGPLKARGRASARAPRFRSNDHPCRPRRNRERR